MRPLFYPHAFLHKLPAALLLPGYAGTTSDVTSAEAVRTGEKIDTARTRRFHIVELVSASGHLFIIEYPAGLDTGRAENTILFLTSLTSLFILNYGGFMRTWSLQNAKARFSELVNVCLQNGPQLVTRHGNEAVVVLSAEEYRRLTTPAQNLKDFFLSAPRVELNIDRQRDAGREVEL